MTLTQTTSPWQDNLAQALFRGFPRGLVTMSTNLHYPSGNVTYTFNLRSDNSEILKITVDGRGRPVVSND